MAKASALDFLVLVLNQDYEPLHVCPGRRAVVLLQRGKAEILEDGRGVIHTARLSFLLPSVIRMAYHIRRPTPAPRFSRRSLFLRDSHTCQYCGRLSRDLTVDHVIPRHRGGQHTWDNVVAACIPCNRRKAGRTPAEARMQLLREPRPAEPARLPFVPLPPWPTPWDKFIVPWQRRHFS
ncbi:MAG: HNH endonuclease [Chloroflexi bacterium]|nr:HNH endonuclease [Chloroflexota bacterium]